MKVKTLASALNKIADSYKKQTGQDATIWSINFSDQEIELCAGLKNIPGGHSAKRPVKKYKLPKSVERLW